MITLPSVEILHGFMMPIFEKLSKQQIEAIIVTGTRAEELQLRLKLAEVEVPIIVG